MVLKKGDTIGLYEILALIGVGGMGEVYCASDPRLGRDVAIKVLPSELAGDPDRLSRFQREARVVAALNHPQIVTIYSVEQANGIHFLTMEMIEGQSLDKIIPAEGLPVARILDIAGELADALAAAHEKGIVHRDLKPANIMVTKAGRVKVLDFGLAKEVGEAGPDDATRTSLGNTQAGMVMGTPAYMSPEQISGRPLDHRTDIFSLGVVLHEMAVGKQPFAGNSSAELISAILRDTPPSVCEIRSDLPGDLARIVRRCMEKDPRYRIQTARDVANEFRNLARQSPQKAALQIQAQAAPSSPAPTPGTPSRTVPAADSSAARADEGFWIAVLPFKAQGASPDLAALADGLSEEIVTGLSRFSYLRVIARGSTAKYFSESGDVRAIGKELGVRYVMEGTLRQAGSKLRLAVQLVDSESAAHLWAENYERTFSPEAIFELQDDLVPRIVSTVADMNGALPRSMSEAVRSKAPEQLNPYEAVLRSFAYFERYTPEELSASRSGLEAAVRKAPAYADAWAMLSYLCAQDYVHGYELQANALDNAAAAARRAVELSPANPLAYFSLAQVLAYQKDFDSFRDAAERAVALNPMDGNSVALIGEYLTYSGNAEHGMQLADRAKQLNPNHPGSYWFSDFYHAFSQGDYRSALAFALKAKLRGNPLAPMFISTAAGQLGEGETAAKAAADLLKFRPELPALMRRQFAKIWNPEYAERFLDGLRKAGIVIPEAGATAGQKTSTQLTSSMLGAGVVPDSGATRAEEGFWIAVLPFKYVGKDDDLTALADGLSEEIVTGLSRFSYLRVIARSSTSRYSQGSVDVRTAGRELGARYVMEGSLRQAGAKLRLAVQLVDAVTGAHLWAENYERSFSPDAIFELQDDLVPRIVSTVADTQGVLPRSMSEILRTRNPNDLSPYEAVLRSFAHFQRVNAEEHAASRAALENAVELQPGYADAWAMLSLICKEEFTHELNLRPDPLGRAFAAAQRAVEGAPANHLAHHALAMAQYFLGDRPAFRIAAERALELNPMDGFSVAFLGSFIAYDGDWELGCKLSARARGLNPHHPGWYWFVPCFDAYRKGDYRLSLEFARKVNMPSLWRTSAVMAAAYGQLGEIESAGTQLRTLLTLRPNFQAEARKELAIYWGPELVEGLIDGLRKAGLDILVTQSQAPANTKSGAVRSAESKPPSIAVLPFANMSADKDQEYFSDGLAEEVINLLAKIPGLKVIARTSAFAFRGKELDIREIADALGVTYILEGSVRRTETRLRVTGQLIDAADGAHLWSERYDREMRDIFSLQDDIAAAIAAALRVKLSPEAMPKRYEPKVPAYEAFLKARYLQGKATPESLELAKQCHQRAIKLDPAFALARAELGFYWVAMTMFGRCPADKAFLAARTEAERALQIDPALPDAHALAGYLSAVFEQNWEKAEQYFAFPGARLVGTSITRPLYGWFQYLRGNVAEAIALAMRAIEDDPLDVWSRMNLHAYLQAADREREALEQLRKVLELDPNQAVAMVSVAMIQADQGNLPEALATARRAHTIGLWLPETTGVLAALLYRNGDDAESQSIAKTLGSGGTPGDARAQALFHLLCGEVDKGADWAERAINEGDLAMRTVYIRFVACKQLRASNRWPKIAKMINLPQA